MIKINNKQKTVLDLAYNPATSEKHPHGKVFISKMPKK